MELIIEDDLDLRRIADSGQCFRWQPLEGGFYRIPAGKRTLTAGPGREPRHFLFDCPEEDLPFWRSYFDLGTDYRSVRRRIPESDGFLRLASEEEQGIRILRQDPWETLITFIISQRKNIPAIKKSVEALCEAAGEQIPLPGGGSFYAFPSPEALAALSPEALCSCRLGYRAGYIHDAALASARGETDLTALSALPDGELAEALMRLRGVGIKVASCVMLFGYGRLDLFPRDVWINRVLENEYPGGFDFRRYAPYNGIMQQYLFAYYRNRSRSGT